MGGKEAAKRGGLTSACPIEEAGRRFEPAGFARQRRENRPGESSGSIILTWPVVCADQKRIKRPLWRHQSRASFRRS